MIVLFLLFVIGIDIEIGKIFVLVVMLYGFVWYGLCVVVLKLVVVGVY